MRIGFNLEYQTTFGEELMLNILAEGKPNSTRWGRSTDSIGCAS